MAINYIKSFFSSPYFPILLLSSAPKETSEEIQEQIEQLTSTFERVNSKAESIAKVKEETNNILESLEDETFQPLVNSFQTYLSTTSNDRFCDVKQEGELPESFVTADYTQLPFELLSHGTKDLAALAWKLAATEYFLGGRSGLIMLDDPMVDMDSERRKYAGQAIHKFANNHQVIIFTCHPYYRDVLETENLVELN